MNVAKLDVRYMSLPLLKNSLKNTCPKEVNNKAIAKQSKAGPDVMTIDLGPVNLQALMFRGSRLPSIRLLLSIRCQQSFEMSSVLDRTMLQSAATEKKYSSMGMCDSTDIVCEHTPKVKASGIQVMPLPKSMQTQLGNDHRTCQLQI